MSENGVHDVEIDNAICDYFNVLHGQVEHVEIIGIQVYHTSRGLVSRYHVAWYLYRDGWLATFEQVDIMDRYYPLEVEAFLRRLHNLLD